MAFVSFPDTVQVVLDFATLGVSWSTSMWFNLPAPTETKASLLVSAIEVELLADLMVELTTNTFYNGATVYDMNTSLSPKWTIPPIAPIAGGTGVAPLPLSAAMCVTFYTNSRGRSGRGRNYISGFDEALGGAQVFTLTVCNTIEAIYQDFLAASLPDGAVWVVASKQQDGVPYTVGATRPITSVAVRNQYFASQRGRVGRP